MRSFTAVVERYPDTGVYVGHIPGLAGARAQGETLDRLNANLIEAVSRILEDGEPAFSAEFVGILTVRI
ncbi:MAG: type II toxin-antitoxin system HicB family antitoxin [Alphaproteobacteria bacterium]|nr:type II toxin-antitoxin system HicB family antitoxin [Alphaproteobacteria bacterium]